MAQTRQEQKLSYPLPAYNFSVTMNGASMSFSEVSGISLENELVTYKHGFSYAEGEDIVMYRSREYTPMTLKRGIVKGFAHLYDWFMSKEPKSLDVSLCDEQGHPLITWQITKAVPVKLEAPTFDANSNDVSLESLELKVTGIAVVYQ